ncbi:hypothetical protein GCM10027596_21980 [Nocardioides korecus]
MTSERGLVARAPEEGHPAREIHWCSLDGAVRRPLVATARLWTTAVGEHPVDGPPAWSGAGWEGVGARTGPAPIQRDRRGPGLISARPPAGRLPTALQMLRP